MSLTLEDKQKAIKLIRGREEADYYDTKELQEKREQWISYLYVHTQKPIYFQEAYKTPEDVVETKPKQYDFFSKNWNLRLKTKHETWVDLDNLPWEKANKVIAEMMETLEYHNIHYCIWDNAGRRNEGKILACSDEYLKLYDTHKFSERFIKLVDIRECQIK
jgi:hypothetical protein